MTKPTICIDCSKKVFYNNTKHICVKYEPVSMEDQIRADELDDENNRNKTGLYFDRNGQQYTLNYDIPLPKCLEIPATDSIPQTNMYIRFECEFCSQMINQHQKMKHQSTKKCQRIKAKYYRGE